MKKLFFLFLIISISSLNFIFVIPAEAASASLYLTPSTGTYEIGAKFSMGVNVNTGGISVNASQGTISFDSSILKVVSVSTGGSVFSLWTQNPAASGASINFGGGIPHPGYTGTAGRVFTVTFQSLKAGTAQVRFISGSVLANDGKGTNILSSMGSASYTISPKSEAPVAPKPKEVPKKPEKPKEETFYLKPEIKSETHPDEDRWYNVERALFNWDMPEVVQGVSVAFNQKEMADPGPLADGIFDSKEYDIESDGHWYFHAKFKDSKNRWGSVTHFRVNFDSAPPKEFDIEVKQDDPTDWPVLLFETEDELSGVDRYEVTIDNFQTEPIIVKAEDKSYKVAGLGTGMHTAIVKAIDRAGNEVFTSVEFEIKTIDPPVIEDYPAEISPKDKFFVSGTAAKNTIITLFIKKDGEDKEISYQTNADKDGNWFIVTEGEHAKGLYTFWASSENDKGLKSDPSAKLIFLVTPPVFAKIGSFIIDYFTVIVSLIFMTVLIIFLLLLIAEMIRRRLKKETIEIEQVLAKNMSELEKATNAEFIKLGKLSKTEFNKEKIAAKKRLAKKIAETNKRILKEVKDVEKILK